MNEKPVPEFMKQYMENIGENCFREYELLSKDYYQERQIYNEKIFPQRFRADTDFGRASGRGRQDYQQEMYRIDETYKARALDIACKHGYQQPDRADFDKDISSYQEDKDVFGNHTDKDDFGLSPEDLRAKQAHKDYEARYPMSPEERKAERDLIEQYYGEGRNNRNAPLENKPQPSGKEQAPPKELTREDRLSGFQETKEETTTNRFMDSLASSREHEGQDRTHEDREPGHDR